MNPRCQSSSTLCNLNNDCLAHGYTSPAPSNRADSPTADDFNFYQISGPNYIPHPPIKQRKTLRYTALEGQFQAQHLWQNPGMAPKPYFYHNSYQNYYSTSQLILCVPHDPSMNGIAWAPYQGFHPQIYSHAPRSMPPPPIVPPNAERIKQLGREDALLLFLDYKVNSTNKEGTLKTFAQSFYQKFHDNFDLKVKFMCRTRGPLNPEQEHTCHKKNEVAFVGIDQVWGLIRDEAMVDQVRLLSEMDCKQLKKEMMKAESIKRQRMSPNKHKYCHFCKLGQQPREVAMPRSFDVFTKIFVGGLSDYSTKEDLNSLFGMFGSCETKIVATCEGPSGFVTFSNRFIAEDVINAMQSYPLYGDMANARLRLSWGRRQDM
jgi:hypothetical protein